MFYLPGCQVGGFSTKSGLFYTTAPGTYVLWFWGFFLAQC